MFLTDKQIAKTQRQFEFFCKNNCGVSQDKIDELRDEIADGELLHRGFSKFNKITKDDKEFYVCDLFRGRIQTGDILRSYSAEDILFEECDDYLVWQRQRWEDSFYGFLAFKMKNGQYWVVEYGD